MPSDLGAGTSAEIEEERRLLYVATTRAKDDLHLVVPQRFFVHGQHAQGDRHLYASRTRFIPEKLQIAHGSGLVLSPALCAGESSWREDNWRVSNGDQANRIAALALKRGKSVDFTGYWQRHIQSA
jgi:ATP-dependent exoDNAse (exonuclease V) beta subunit